MNHRLQHNNENYKAFSGVCICTYMTWVQAKVSQDMKVKTMEEKNDKLDFLKTINFLFKNLTVLARGQALNL